MTPDQVTACLVTRGDQPDAIRRIIQSLIFETFIVWNNSTHYDWKTAGRYMAAERARTDVVYFQDDDTIVPPETQQALVDAYEPGVMVATWGHGEDPAGYDDLPLVCGGGIIDAEVALDAMNRYLDVFPFDDGFLYDCDFAVGVLYPAFRHIDAPFEIDLAIAQHPSRLVNQPWQAELKARTTARARALRDGLELPDRDVFLAVDTGELVAQPLLRRVA